MVMSPAATDAALLLNDASSYSWEGVVVAIVIGVIVGSLL